MSQLQVLVATMHQADFSIGQKMNIRCDAVFANQADREEICNLNTENGTWKMITTHTRGVGLNRNIALLAADAQILLFADDDMTYYDDMSQAVINAFCDNPQADVLVFGVDIMRDGQITERRHLKNKRLHIWNALRFGTCAIAIRRKSLVQYNITFNQNFGGGCPFSAGEDSLLLKSCIDAGLKIYSHEYVLGTCCKDTSSWFVGYNNKYFYDKGVLVRYLFPKACYLMAMYFAVRFKHKTEVSLFRRIGLVYRGVYSGKYLKTYWEAL